MVGGMWPHCAAQAVTSREGGGAFPRRRPALLLRVARGCLTRRLQSESSPPSAPDCRILDHRHYSEPRPRTLAERLV